ncbi:MAG: YceI family protein [Bacteroidia bacterium]
MEKTLTKTLWNIDPAHSEIQFKVKHLVISTVTGAFNQFTATVETESPDNFEGAAVSFEADVNSVSTNNEQRDVHLRSADFFDAENHPTIGFRSTGFSGKGDGTFVLTGDLTIRGVTQPVTLDVEYGGTTKDPWGQTKAGFEAVGKISRKDFGLLWNAPIESGGVLVADEVKLILNVQFTQQA